MSNQVQFKFPLLLLPLFLTEPGEGRVGSVLAHVWRPEENLQELVLLFLYVVWSSNQVSHTWWLSLPH